MQGPQPDQRRRRLLKSSKEPRIEILFPTPIVKSSFDQHPIYFDII